MKLCLLIVLFSLYSADSLALTAIDSEEAKAIAEMKAQEAAMAEAQKKATPVARVVASPQDQASLTPPEAPVASEVPLAPVVPVNNLTNFYRSISLHKPGSSSVFYINQPYYRMRASFFERLGYPKGSLVKCPIPDHALHFVDEGVVGILMENPLKHADMPPLKGLAIEARDYVQSLTLRENLRVHMYTYGYVVYEDNGDVLTVEIKD